jgi:polyphosphate kinase
MPRNLDRRIEVSCPIFDPGLRKEMKDVFDIQWKDNVKARVFDETQSNKCVRKGDTPFRSQTEVHRHILDINGPTPEARQE